MSAFYDLASLVVVPSGYKSGKIYAQKPLTTDGQLTFSRASTATRVNSAGLIETVSSNVPRLDYLGSTCPKLQLEPQRTNVVTYNSAFNSGSWIALNGTRTSNVTTSPDGTTNAGSFVPNTDFAIHALRSNLFNQSSTAAHSWFVKANGYTKVAVRESELVGNYASFNLATGTLISTNQTGSIVNYGNGWYRLTLVDTTTGANAQTSIIVLPDSYTTGDPIINWSGDGTKGVYVFGAQVELGAYPTSLINTTTAAVTRLEDECNKTSVSTLIGQAEGTLFVEANLTHSAAVNDYLIQVSESGSNRILIYREGTTNKLGCFALIGSTTIYNQLTAAATTGTIKAAFAYKSGSFAFYVNGVQVGTSSATFTTPPTMGRVDIDSNIGLENGFYNYAQALLFKTRLTNAQLAELTTL